MNKTTFLITSPLKYYNNRSFDEKCDPIPKLGIKVYPPEDGKVMRILSRLNPDAEFKVSPYKISIASPKL